MATQTLVRPAPTVPEQAQADPAAPAQLQAHKRPAYIIVFHRPSERNVNLLEKTLKLKASSGPSTRAGRMQFNARAEGRSPTLLYHRLGIAATDLEEPEVEQLLHSENVAAIVPNRIRSLPTPIEKQPFEIGGASSKFREEIPQNPAAAYLLGMRDAAEVALRALQPGSTFFTPSPAALAAPLPATVWHLAAINIAATTATGKGVKVAVLDTGIDLHHPDFLGIFTAGVNSESFVEGESIQDEHGHGTHCAGLVAGPLKPKGVPRYGVAPDASLLIGKVLNKAGKGTDDEILNAIDWAIDAGANIISMSLGSERYPGEPFAAPYETVAATLLNSQPGILLVAAAGNESNRPYFTQPVGNPAACPSIMSVAAVDEQRHIAYFSCSAMDNIGLVDLSAPGVAVTSSFKGGGYRLLSGTSMATPIVAGTAALHLEQNPSLDAKGLWESLKISAIPLGNPQDFGAGLVQAMAPSPPRSRGRGAAALRLPRDHKLGT